jgi:hypothetical protein
VSEPPPKRRSTRDRAALPPLKVHPIGTPRGTSSNAAVLAVGAWLSARGLVPPMNQWWSIELALDVNVGRAEIGVPATGTSFHLHLNADAWGFTFSHDNRVSSIRVVDIPSVNGRDDHQLLASTPSLKELGPFVRRLEQRYDILFRRNAAAVRTTVAGAEPIVLAWASTI